MYRDRHHPPARRGAQRQRRNVRCLMFERSQESMLHQPRARKCVRPHAKRLPCRRMHQAVGLVRAVGVPGPTNESLPIAWHNALLILSINDRTLSKLLRTFVLSDSGPIETTSSCQRCCLAPNLVHRRKFPVSADHLTEFDQRIEGELRSSLEPAE